MKSRIWGFDLAPHGVAIIDMPIDCKILSVGYRSGTPNLWCLVDPGSARADRYFISRQTGEEFIHNYNHIFVGTAILESTIVLHIFELLKPDDNEKGERDD